MALMSVGFTTLQLATKGIIVFFPEETVVAVAVSLEKAHFLRYNSLDKIPLPKNSLLSDELGFTFNFHLGFTYNV